MKVPKAEQDGTYHELRSFHGARILTNAGTYGFIRWAGENGVDWSLLDGTKQVSLDWSQVEAVLPIATWEWVTS